MPIKAIFFDLGETLLDERRMWREWADYLGVTESAFLAVLHATIGRGEHHRRAFELLQPGFDPKAAWRARVADGTAYSFRPEDLYPDAAPCLSSLRKSGFFIGIAGNQSRDLLDSVLALGLQADLVTTSDHLGFDKPSTGFFEALIARSGFRSHQIAYVGDRVDNDILPAQAVGMTAVFIERGPWGRIHAQKSDAARADIRIAALSDLPEALESFNAARR